MMKISFVIIATFIFDLAELKIFFNQSEENEKLNKCISKIYENNSNSTLIIHGSKLEFNIFTKYKLPVVIINWNHFSFVELNNIGIFNMFMFYVDDLNSLRNLFMELKNLKFWKSRAKFLIVFQQNIDIQQAFEIIWKEYIYNVIIIIKHFLQFTVYTFYPYEKDNCGLKIEPHELNCEYEFNFFPDKVGLTLPGCKIRVITFSQPRPPFVMNVNHLSEDAMMQGFEVTILGAVAKKLNCIPDYVHHPYNDFGVIFPNGSVTLMFQLLLENKGDVLFGGVFDNVQLVKLFDFVQPHGIYNILWYVPTAKEIPKWQNLLMLFNYWLWFAIFGTVLVHALTCYLINLVKERHPKQIALCILYSLSILLQISVNYPKINVLKYLFLMWSVGSLLIYTLYQSQLVSVLTTPIFEKQIKTMNDVFNSKIQYGFNDIINNAYNRNISIEKKILDGHVSCTFGIECVNRTAFQRDFAIMKNNKQVEYWIPRYYTDITGRKLLYIVDEFTYLSLCWMYTVKGYPLLDRMTKIVFGLIENGLVYKWEADMKFVVRKEISEETNQPLSLNHLQTPFYILIFGLLLSLIVFLCEMLKFKNKNCSNLFK